ncbi:hypothetical protein SASPL_152743 [Salvia splendens]|uniref:DNA (cytosine-5-)-methyltransferase n=1 Tax=Salvia splendens TaxID=180675 RepID=A0A8X8Z0N0_SALSN|nr:hypothetical protein SASPL_152743 [Salvia splendens]
MWETYGGLSSCPEKLKELVLRGYKSRNLPLPRTVDVVCGGPPCQGISGFNRFRNKDAPLEDIKNKQLVVFMDIVSHIRPKFVLVENVVDLVKFADGFLGGYAMGCLVGMGIKLECGNDGSWCIRPRMGMMTAGAYGVTPLEFEINTVTYEEGCKLDLKKALVLGDAISDLPHFENDKGHD